MSTVYPFARPLYVMAKPAGPKCNLRCQYCYYLEKQHLAPSPVPSPEEEGGGAAGSLPSGRFGGGRGFGMSPKLLEQYIRDYIQLQQTPDVLFTWHGGEPMLKQSQQTDGHIFRLGGKQLLQQLWRCRLCHGRSHDGRRRHGLRLFGGTAGGGQHKHDSRARHGERGPERESGQDHLFRRRDGGNHGL